MRAAYKTRREPSRGGTPFLGIQRAIGEHRFKRPSMQIQIKHIRGSESWRRKGTDKQFVDGAVTLDANFGGRGGASMGGHHQTDLGSSWRQGNGWAVVERACHPAFRMGAHLIRYARKCLLDDLQIQEAVVTTSGNHPNASSQDIDERSGVAIEHIQTKQYGSGGKRN